VRIATVTGEGHGAAEVWVNIIIDSHRVVCRNVPHVVVAEADGVVGQRAVDSVVVTVDGNGCEAREAVDVAT
jgi:hypothetical protein